MEPFNIIALDPGGTTGIAMATYNGIWEPTIANFRIETSELGPHEHHEELDTFITSNWLEGRAVYGVPNYLVCESFEFRQNLDKRKVELISKEYIGICKLIVAGYNIKYVEQSASMAKGFVTDEKLDRLGILEIPKYPNRHRNDALRHMIRFMVVGLKIRSPITSLWKEETDG